MKIGKKTYQFLKQLHLYCALITSAFLLMYIVTSFMWMNHGIFHVDVANKSETIIKLSESGIQGGDWDALRKAYHIGGRLTREQSGENGEVVRTYSRAGSNTKITVDEEEGIVRFVSTEMNLSGKITALHRLRGYGGSLSYMLYAVILDLVGLSLILFTVSGVILWLKLLQFNRTAWVILLLGFVYVSAVITYLMLH